MPSLPGVEVSSLSCARALGDNAGFKRLCPKAPCCKPVGGAHFERKSAHFVKSVALSPPASMAKLSILRYPDPRLHTVARPVAQVDTRIQSLVDDMLETMYAAQGIGLAATQVDVHERVIVIDVSEERKEPLVLINPELVAVSDEMIVGDEGCLSVPAIYDKVERHARVSVRALDREGRERTLEAEELLAVCVQHEMDHLRGKVFVEYLSTLKRNRIRAKMLKRSKEEQDE